MVSSRASVGTWRDLLTKYLGITVVLAGGELLGSLNIYVSSSLLPTAIKEIGGEELYAWNTSLYMVAMVVGTALVGQVLARLGGVGAYMVGFGLFMLGSVCCAVAPVTPVMLVGRLVQGAGGGLLSGLGFAVIQSALPQHLWTRGTAVGSAMFATGNFVGPAIGGLFAQFGSWRYAFVVLAGVAVLIAVLMTRVLPRRGKAEQPARFPVLSMVLITATTLAVSVAGIVPAGWPTAVVLVAGVLLLVAFLGHERRTSVRILTKSVFIRGTPLKWIYLSIGVIGFGVGIEAFLPLFGQRLGGLQPVLAGFFGALVSLGWALTQILSSSAKSARITRTLRQLGPLVIGIGIAALGALQQYQPPVWLVVVWFAVVLLAGAGMGMALPHLAAATMGSTVDPDEAAKASSGIATVLTSSTAFGAALAGVLVNLGTPSVLSSAHYLLFTFAIICALGTISARASQRTRS